MQVRPHAVEQASPGGVRVVLVAIAAMHHSHVVDEEYVARFLPKAELYIGTLGDLLKAIQCRALFGRHATI